MAGLRIVWDMRPDGDEWSGGRILVLESGKGYKAKMKLNEDGSQLEVRGSVAFFGRSQFWHRIE